MKRDFSDWIKDRIKKYDFMENQDYVCSPVLGSNGRGGHNAIDYHLSLDMAKELSMVERSAKGKEDSLMRFRLSCMERNDERPGRRLTPILQEIESGRATWDDYPEITGKKNQETGSD